MRVSNGRSALSRVRTEAFDAAVIASTGEEMDVVETVLNLRDIRAAMPVFILAERARSDETQSRLVLGARLLTLDALIDLLGERRGSR